MNRRLRIAMTAILAFSLFASISASTPTPAAALACAGGTADFMGNRQTPSVAPRGVAATIQAINYSLCTGGAGTFSAAWVSLEGLATSPGYNIYQVGYDKCTGSVCGPTSLVNALYYFYAYGRNGGGPCGAAIVPVPVRIPLAAPTGEHRFKIDYAGAPGVPRYVAYIDNDGVHDKLASDLEDCWPTGVVRSGFFNEVFDLGTQSGGRVADKQDFEDVRYKTGAWNLLTRALGATCDYQDRTTQRCITSTVDSNNYYMWDTRFP